MQYLILIYGDEKAWARMTKQDQEKMFADHMAYAQAMGEAGVMRGGNELAPIATATTLRLVNGKTVTTDGPFAETKEQLGGYYLIDCANLDEALQWASKCPGIRSGSIEVRPVIPH